MKICFRCGLNQPITEYYLHAAMKDGRLNKCRTCTKADAQRWRDENRERFVELRWAREIRQKYGITPDDYDRMFKEQDGRCAGCGSRDPGGHGRVFVIDHCHDTGRVRGLLCDKCNLALGNLNDDGRRLRSLAAYADKQAAIRSGALLNIYRQEMDE